MKLNTLAGSLLAVSLLGACGAAATSSAAQPTGQPSAGPSADAASSSNPGAPSNPPTGTAPSSAATPGAIWRTVELRDVRTGETFRLDSLAGQLVVVEAMAIWCSNCRVQQMEARTVLERLNRPDLVYISLDIDPFEAEPDLARYADEHGFAWRFVVASPEVARALAQSFGDQVLSPPSVPIIVINPNGQVEQTFGHRGATELEADLAARLP